MPPISLPEQLQDSRWLSQPWLQKLGENDRLWLLKEQQEATCASPWMPPPIGLVGGTIFLNRLTDNYFAGVQKWYVDAYGSGLDGVPLLRPQCTWEELQARPDPEASDLQVLAVAVARLTMRVQALERGAGRLGVSIPATHLPPPDELSWPTNRLARRREVAE